MGFSQNGMMQGPAGANSNVMIVDFAKSTMGQYDMLGYAGSQIVAHDTSGVGNMSWYQTASTSVMSWSRQAHNGDASDAQISLTGVSNIVWAVGLGNGYASSPLPPMGNTIVDLSGVASASGTASETPSPSASSSGGYVAPSSSPAPSPVSYTHSAVLTTGLTLWWSREGDRFDFQAVYDGLAW